MLLTWKRWYLFVQHVGNTMFAIKVSIHDLQRIKNRTTIFSAAGFDLASITAGVSITAALVLVLVCICLVCSMKRYDYFLVDPGSLNIILYFMLLDMLHEFCNCYNEACTKVIS